MNPAVLASAVKAIGRAAPRDEVIALAGGLDQVTPTMQRLPGFCRRAQNFASALNGGYRRVDGYERFSGKTKPSDAQYGVINVTISGTFNAGDTVTGQTSGATGKVLTVVTTSTPNYLVLTKTTGTFQSGENLQVSAVTQGVSSSLLTLNGAPTIKLHAQYRNFAADDYRNDIAAVPGSGPVRGVQLFNNVVYAFRNNSGGTQVDLWKSTASGWAVVPYGEEVSFTGGNSSVGDGDTLTQGGVTATIKRVVVTSGTSPNLVGRLVIHSRSGGDLAAGAATSTGGGALTLSGIQTNITPLPGGRFEFHVANFTGASATRRIYGCDGVNRGFEFDGTDFGYVPISTGMSQDTPTHVREHKKHLFFSFGPSAQHSGIGLPFQWTPVSGAAELAVSEDITGFQGQPGSEGGGALVIFTRNRTYVLYGTSSSDWVLNQYREELGAFPYTIQDVGYTVYLDDRGVTNLQTAQEFGNFSHATMSNLVRPTINTKRAIAISSCVSRDLSQYRIFFSDKSALYFTLVGSEVIGIMPMLFPDTVRCITSAEFSDGSEGIFFGDDNGFVYQMEKGTSFDGDAIEAFIELTFNFSRGPRMRKRYRGAMLELDGTAYAEFAFGYVLGYGSTEFDQPGTIPVNLSSAFWDSFFWDNFTWDGSTLVPNRLDLGGTANNISLSVHSEADYFEPFTLTGLVLFYTPRRPLR